MLTMGIYVYILAKGIVFVILLIIKFRKGPRLEDAVSKDDLASLLTKLKGLMSQNDISEKTGVDLQRLMLSKIIKYLFTNYAKLSFV
jgi:hypothetical protein